MAKRVRYTGTAGIRKISAADFKKVGVEDQQQIEVAGVNLGNTALKRKMGHEVEVSDAAAKYLTENEAFVLVESDSTDTKGSTKTKA